MSIQNSHQISDVKILLKQGATGASIVSITKTGTSGLVDTYTVATSDGGRYTFEVTNGSDIQSIEKTSSHGEVDTYTVTLTNGNTTTFEVTNGDNWIDNSEKTATDSFQTITGGLLKMCKVALSPVLSGSGDPSPTNVRPITGHDGVKVQRNGKNFLPFPYATTSGSVNGLTYIINSDGTVLVNGKATADTEITLYAFVFPNARTYKFMGCPAGGSVDSYFMQIRGTSFLDVGAGSIDSDAGGVARNVQIRIKNNTECDNLLFKPMITLDTDATSYESYKGETYLVYFPSGTGTVYGGTLDLVSGELVINKGICKVSDLTWSVQSSAFANFKTSTKQSEIAKSDSDVEVLSDSYLACSNQSAVSGRNYQIYSNTDGEIKLNDTRYTTASDLVNSMGNATIVYALATPTVVQLTPTQVETLIGENNLFCPWYGQAMVEDGVKYFYIYTYHDLMDAMQVIADAMEEDVHQMTGDYTTTASASVGDTSITISDANITTSSIIEVYCQNASGNAVAIKNMTVTTGQAVLTFYALAEATDFRLHILNI